ncbi:MAG: hypothetical protein BroJett011_53990 [Chloroflexota bacterium]|nr:MAG: hypothetical protein BroJett011_53990 [Chloroflexota bacterium]
MQTIFITVPYEKAEKEVELWANEERSINFRRDQTRACRCTSAFMALELKRYLARTLRAVEIYFLAAPPGSGLTIELKIEPGPAENGGFAIRPSGQGVVIQGKDRAGLVYGVYELLRHQGWRWYAPGATGEHAPALRDELALPLQPLDGQPALPWRGFDFAFASMESAELLLWMARNRLNVYGWRPATGPLGRKLGMTPRVGGHIFETMLDPDRRLMSGETLWEAHQPWYGLPAHGERRKESALRTQFCVSQEDLIEFLGEEILQKLMEEWREADIIDIWGFDTWGSTCACPGCQSLGNATDQTLYFLSRLRNFLNGMRRQGRLDHEVKLAVCAYEGTATLAGPERPFPANLLEAGDYCIFYPISRCYAHDLADTACDRNVHYHTALTRWLKHRPAMPVIIGEYYNVSKWQDLPVLFTTRMQRDIPDYVRAGAAGLTYMHVPLVNWGLRTITQLLHAQLAWDISTDGGLLLQEYFAHRYGPYAEAMQQVYAHVEQAWLYIAQWRTWGPSSILSQLLAWDGTPPPEPLPLNEHFASAAAAISSGRRSLQLMQAAAAILHEIRAKERIRAAQTAVKPAGQGVNPQEERNLTPESPFELRLDEAKRSLVYGFDTMMLMVELLAYHDALFRHDDETAGVAWNRVENAAGALDSYYVPIGYEWPGPGLESYDGLTRSQLGHVLRLCRKYRLSKNETA